jgi:outer membrane protein
MPNRTTVIPYSSPQPQKWNWSDRWIFSKWRQVSVQNQYLSEHGIEKVIPLSPNSPETPLMPRAVLNIPKQLKEKLKLEHWSGHWKKNVKENWKSHLKNTWNKIAKKPSSLNKNKEDDQPETPLKKVEQWQWPKGKSLVDFLKKVRVQGRKLLKFPEKLKKIATAPLGPSGNHQLSPKDLLIPEMANAATGVSATSPKTIDKSPNSSKKEDAGPEDGSLMSQIKSHLLLTYLKRIVEITPRLKAAKTQIAIEQSKGKVNRGDWLPKVDLVASAEHIRQNFDGLQKLEHPSKISLNIQQKIFDRSTHLNSKVSRLDTQFAEVSSEIEIQNVIEEACRRYLQLHRFQKNLDFSRNNAGLANEHLRSTKIRQESGELTITDVKQALVRYKTAKAVNRETTIQVDIAKHRLEEFLQMQPEKDLPMFDIFIPKVMIDDILKNESARLRPDIQLLQLRKEKEKLQLAKIKAQYLPTLSLSASQSRSWDHNVVTTSLTGNPLNESSIAIDFSFNIFNGGSTAYQRLTSEERLTQFNQNILHQQREAIRQVHETALQVELSQELEELYREAVEAAKNALEGIQEEFLVGTRTALDAFDAQNELFISQTRWLNAKIDHAMSSIALLKYVGKLDLQHLKLYLMDESQDAEE